MSRKEYLLARSKYNKVAYTKLRTNFKEKVLEIVKSMNSLLPQAQKDANKDALKNN